MAVVLAAPASALSVVPLCNDAPISGGFTVIDAQDAGNGFVVYEGVEDRATGGDAIIVLEHCRTGRVLFALGRWDGPETDPQHPTNLRDAVNDFVNAERAYTMTQMVAGLKDRGIAARVETWSDEGCACSTWYPDLRGRRAPYQG